MNLALRLARREMRSGLGGFRLFIACLGLGVGAQAFLDGAAEGQDGRDRRDA